MSGKAVVTVTDKRTVHTDALDILGRVITDEDQIGRDAIHLAVEPVVAGGRVYPGQDVGRLADGTFAAPGVNNGITRTLGIVDPFIKGPVQPGEKFLLVIYPRQITTLRHVWEHPEFGPDVINPATVTESKLYHVILKSSGLNKIHTIKAIRTITNLGLKESKDLTENCPSFVLEHVSYDLAEIAYNHLKTVADVQIVEAKPATKAVDTDVIINWPSALSPAQKESKAWIKQFAHDLKKGESYYEDEGHTFDELMEIAKKYLETGTYGYIGNSDVYDQDWKAFWMHYKVLTGKGPAPGADDVSFFSCSC